MRQLFSGGNWNANVNLSAFPQGLHTVIAYVNDTVGNLNNTVNISFTVDKTFSNVTLNFLNNPVDYNNFSIRSSNQTFNASVFDALLQIDTVYFWFDNGTEMISASLEQRDLDNGALVTTFQL